MIEQRRARERAAKALENAPVIHPKALRTPPPPVVTYAKEEVVPPSVSLAAMDVSPPSVAPASKPEPSGGSVDGKVPVWVWVLVAVVVATVTYVVSRR